MLLKEEQTSSKGLKDARCGCWMKKIRLLAAAVPEYTQAVSASILFALSVVRLIHFGWHQHPPKAGGRHMYIQDWDTFAEQAEALYRSDPLKVRYVLKYRHCDGKAVLKVTDDKTALQYKTDQIADIKKVEKLNLLFFTLMSQGSDAEIPAMEPTDTAAASQVQEPIQKPHTTQQSKKGQKRRKG